MSGICPILSGNTFSFEPILSDNRYRRLMPSTKRILSCVAGIFCRDPEIFDEKMSALNWFPFHKVLKLQVINKINCSCNAFTICQKGDTFMHVIYRLLDHYNQQFHPYDQCPLRLGTCSSFIEEFLSHIENQAEQRKKLLKEFLGCENDNHVSYDKLRLRLSKHDHQEAGFMVKLLNEIVTNEIYLEVLIFNDYSNWSSLIEHRSLGSYATNQNICCDEGDTILHIAARQLNDNMTNKLALTGVIIFLLKLAHQYYNTGGSAFLIARNKEGKSFLDLINSIHERDIIKSWCLVIQTNYTPCTVNFQQNDQNKTFDQNIDKLDIDVVSRLFSNRLFQEDFTFRGPETWLNSYNKTICRKGDTFLHLLSRQIINEIEGQPDLKENRLKLYGLFFYLIIIACKHHQKGGAAFLNHLNSENKTFLDLLEPFSQIPPFRFWMQKKGFLSELAPQPGNPFPLKIQSSNVSISSNSSTKKRKREEENNLQDDEVRRFTELQKLIETTPYRLQAL